MNTAHEKVAEQFSCPAAFRSRLQDCLSPEKHKANLRFAGELSFFTIQVAFLIHNS
jgi:hypothetical protein